MVSSRTLGRLLGVAALLTGGSADTAVAETTCAAFVGFPLAVDQVPNPDSGGGEEACFRAKVIAALNSRGRSNGLAGLDTMGRLPASQLPLNADVSGWNIKLPDGTASTLASTVAGRLSQAGGSLTGLLSVPKLQIGSIADAAGLNPIYSYINESASPGQGVFGPSHVFVVNRLGGNGNREAVHIEADTSVGRVGDQIVGGMSAGRIVAGSGTAYGWNAYARVDEIAGPDSQAIGEEVNVDARRDVAAKVGIQIVDVATSTGAGASIDAALLMSRQTGAKGFETGIQFGYNSKEAQASIDAGYGIRSGGTLINALPTTLALRSGLDLSGVQKPFTDAAVKLAVGNAIRFGANGAGGSVVSATATSGGSMLFGANLTVIDFGGGQQNKFTPSGYTTTGSIIESTPATPAHSSSPCSVGQHAWDASYEYRCVAMNHWKRVPLSDF